MNPIHKAFRIPGNQIQRLIPDMGGCLASGRITVDGMKVGYMYREERTVSPILVGGFSREPRPRSMRIILTIFQFMRSIPFATTIKRLFRI